VNFIYLLLIIRHFFLCRGVECCDVEFTDCKVHKSGVLGNTGEGLNVIQRVSNKNKYLQTFAIVKYLR